MTKNLLVGQNILTNLQNSPKLLEFNANGGMILLETLMILIDERKSKMGLYGTIDIVGHDC